MNTELKNIEDQVIEFIRNKELIKKGGKLLLSLSAGKDSMALLEIMARLKDNLSFSYAIFHLNHLQRGEESDEDERFLIETAEKNGIDIFSRKFDFNKNKQGGISFEESARNKRYELLNAVIEEKKFDKIVTAHTKDDNIETILMRILSGAGIHGLGGIKEKKGNIIRPLLILSSKDIYNYLKANKIEWREDSSNKNNTYQRNYIRNTILPKIYDRFDRAGSSILSLSKISLDYASIIDDLLFDKYGAVIAEEQDNVIIDIENIISDRKLFNYVISKAIRDYFGGYVNGGMLREIYKKVLINKTHVPLYENKSCLILKTLRNNKNVIVISKKIEYKYDTINEWEYEIELEGRDNKKYYLKEIELHIEFKVVNFNFFIKNKSRKDLIFIALDDEDRRIIIRNRRRGDKIRLENCSKKIKELMIDCKLDNKIKMMIPLCVINSKIASFMPGLIFNEQNRVSIDFQVKESAKKVLAIVREQ